ncbi:hypothetical protein [Mycolicibacter minnesotensis]
MDFLLSHFVHVRMSVRGPVSMGVCVLVLDAALLVGVSRVFLIAGSGV